MGNISSSGGDGRRRHNRRRIQTLPTADPPPPPPPPHPPSLPPQPPPQPPTEITANRFVFAAATPYPNPNPNPNQAYYYSPQPGTPLPAAYQQPYHHHLYYPPQPLPYHHRHPWTTGGRYPYGGPMMPPQPPPPPPLPYVEHQKAVTIRNDVNLKKETLRLDSDPENPGRFLVSFMFDATVSGRITVIFFAKESEECNLTATKEDILPPITMDFEKGLGQKFKQPSGSGIDFSAFDEVELFKAVDTDIYPLAVKAEASPPGDTEEERLGSKNSQITQAVFEKDKGEIKIKVVKQILWVNGVRYELQEIYGIGNAVDGDESSADDANDSGKECVICLSEPRDTTVLPCRHMCMCSECAKVLRFQTNRCPICRQPVERLLEIKVHGNSVGQGETTAETRE